MDASRSSLVALVALAIGACDAPSRTFATPSAERPTPVPVLPVPFRLAFVPRAAILLTRVSFKPQLILTSSFGEPSNANGARLVSRNPDVASVDSFGVITGQSAGTTWVIASLDGIAAPDSIQITVRCNVDFYTDLSPTEATLRVGESLTPTIVLREACNPKLILQKPVVWFASDTTILQVDSTTGRSTARRPGATWLYPLVDVTRYNVGAIAVTVILP